MQEERIEADERIPIEKERNGPRNLLKSVDRRLARTEELLDNAGSDYGEEGEE